MKNRFRKWKWYPGLSGAQLRLQLRIRETVKEWVEQKGYIKPISSIERLAEDIGLPRDQLDIYVRLRTRKTVLGWRKELRIREAKKLLLEYPELPYSVVGIMVGIDDKSNFKRQFEQIAGMSPRVWREKHLRKA